MFPNLLFFSIPEKQQEKIGQQHQTETGKVRLVQAKAQCQKHCCRHNAAYG